MMMNGRWELHVITEADDLSLCKVFSSLIFEKKIRSKKM